MVLTVRSLLALTILLCCAVSLDAQGRWVVSVRTSPEWQVVLCKDYLITNICGPDKTIADSGSLPPVISVGDLVSYVASKGHRKTFAVRHINFFSFDRDVDFKWGKEHFKAKKGDTICNLYDAKRRSATRDTAYPSKIVVRACRVLR